MKISDVVLKSFILSDIQENCYVVSLKGRTDCVIVDPGIDPTQVVEYIRDASLTPSAILITHGHFDHIFGIPVVESAFPNTPIHIGEKDLYKLGNPDANLSTFFGNPFSTQEEARGVQEDEVIDAAGMQFEVLEVPGHSAGHVVYLLKTEERSIAFCGDVIFSGSVGRTDFPDGSQADLLKNIREKILVLPNEALLCVGHGPVTTVIEEKRSNPYL